MSDSDRIINRIKKCLAMANDERGNDSERDTALRQAYALMAKHNLDLAAVQGQPDTPQEERIKRASQPVYCRPWSLSLANYISELFFCKLFYMKTGARDEAILYFVGRQSNAEAAAEVAYVLIESIWREAKRRMRQEHEGAAWRRSFCTGATFKIGDRVRDLQRNGVSLEAPMKDEDGEEIPMLEEDKKQARSTALVLVDHAKKESEANEAWIKAQVGALKTTKSRAKASIRPDAYHDGRSFGSSLGLAANKKLPG